MRLPLAVRPAFTLSLMLAAAGLAACGSDSSGPTGPSGPPVVSAVNGATAPAGPTGSTVLLEGSNFGSSQGTSTVLFSDGAAGTVAAVIASPGDWTDRYIITTVPAGAATGNLIVQTSKGSSTPIVFTVSQSQAFSPSTISWTATNALPVGRRGLAAASAVLKGASTTPVVYAIGGEDSARATSRRVFYATVGATGTLNAWTETDSLPAATAFGSAIVATRGNSRVKATGYLYLLGGATDAPGTPSAAIYRGTLNADGSVGSWTPVGSLPQPLHSAGAALFDGDIYLFGGSTTGNVPVATVYRARIDSLGNLSAWQTLAPLPFRRSYFGAGEFGGVLYAFGGDSGTVTPNDSVESSATAFGDVEYAKIDLRTGSLTAAGWTAGGNKLKKAVSKHTAVIAAGNVLITAGLYNGAKTGSTEESYAQLNADGSTGSFNGATGSNTINALGGGNLFNQAATGYVDGNGAFHVLVLGGDDVNTPGTTHKGVYFY